MTQGCYKTHREDPQTFPKIDAVSTSQLLRGNTKTIFNVLHTSEYVEYNVLHTNNIQGTTHK